MGFQLREGPPNVAYFQQSGSTATEWYPGDPVYLSSGKVLIASSGADVLGIAATQATGTASSWIAVYLLSLEQIWSIGVDSATTPVIASHVGVRYGLTVSTGATVLDIASATAAGWYVVGLDERDTAAAGSRVLVKPESDTIQIFGD